MNKNEPTITILLKDFVSSHLGAGYWHSREISSPLALTIFSITKNAGTCYIQFNDRNDEPLEKPILWDWAAWQQDCVGWEINKVRSHRLRVERFLLEDNAKVVAKAWSIFSGTDEDKCLGFATVLLMKKQINKIRVFYWGHLKEKEEEL